MEYRPLDNITPERKVTGSISDEPMQTGRYSNPYDARRFVGIEHAVGLVPRGGIAKHINVLCARLRPRYPSCTLSKMRGRASARRSGLQAREGGKTLCPLQDSSRTRARLGAGLRLAVLKDPLGTARTSHRFVLAGQSGKPSIFSSVPPSRIFVCAREDSNLYRLLRMEVLYPFNHGRTQKLSKAGYPIELRAHTRNIRWRDIRRRCVGAIGTYGASVRSGSSRIVLRSPSERGRCSASDMRCGRASLISGCNVSWGCTKHIMRYVLGLGLAAARVHPLRLRSRAKP